MTKKDDDFLREYFKESQAFMIYRSGVEYRLLQFLLLFYPIIGLIFSTLYESPIDSRLFLCLTIGVALALIFITILVNNKICAEHETYRKVGLSIQKVWTYFRLAEKGAYLDNDSIVPEDVIDERKGYGTGKGYLKTLWIVWALAIVVILLVIILGIFKFVTPSTTQPDSSANVSTFYPSQVEQ